MFVLNRNTFKRKNKKTRSFYATKEYRNPFFDKKNKRYSIAKGARITVKIKLLALLFFVLLIALAILLLYSPYFHIKNLEINGGVRIDPNSINKIITEQLNANLIIFLPQKNIFLFNKNRLRKTLESKYAFNSLTIKKKLPATIRVYYEEKSYALIWQENDEYYYIDPEGYIADKANLLEISEKDYPIIRNNSENKIFNRKVEADQLYFQKALELFAGFKNYENLKIERFNYYAGEDKYIRMKIFEGPDVYFNMENDLNKQIEKLLILKNDKIKNDFNEKIYIDLRFGESVYYR